MMPIKINCSCGQNYTFEVEPVAGRMPSTVACPICGADGTAAANDIIAQNLSATPAPAPIAAPSATQGGVHVVSGAKGAAMLAGHIAAASLRNRDESEERKWKWWYFILAGICIGGYSIWQAYTQHTLKPLGSLFLAVFCIAIGIWDFFHQRKKARLAAHNASTPPSA